MEAAPEGYRKNAGICLINISNKNFGASRLRISGAWQMPQLQFDFAGPLDEGGVDDGEDSREAAIRELSEETGSNFQLSYGPYLFPFRFTGKDEEINLLGDGTEKTEFAEWSWMTPQQIIDLAVGFKQPEYEEVLKVFAPYLR